MYQWVKIFLVIAGLSIHMLAFAAAEPTEIFVEGGAGFGPAAQGFLLQQLLKVPSRLAGDELLRCACKLYGQDNVFELCQLNFPLLLKRSKTLSPILAVLPEIAGRLENWVELVLDYPEPDLVIALMVEGPSFTTRLSDHMLEKYKECTDPSSAKALLEKALSVGVKPKDAKMAIAWKEYGYDRSEKESTVSEFGQARAQVDDKCRLLLLCGVDPSECVQKAVKCVHPDYRDVLSRLLMAEVDRAAYLQKCAAKYKREVTELI